MKDVIFKKSLLGGTLMCPVCGHQTVAENDYCPKCGTKLNVPFAVKNEREIMKMHTDTMMALSAMRTDEERERFFQKVGNISKELEQNLREGFFYFRCVFDPEFNKAIKEAIGPVIYRELRGEDVE